jgi:hypothetical protein
MAELISTRCKQGKLILTDTAIVVELGSFMGNLRSETMMRSSFVDLDTKLAVPSLFGKGGGVNLTFHGQGNKVIHADLVKPDDAKRIQAILTGRE